MYEMKRQETTGLWIVVDTSTGRPISRAENPQTAINLAVEKGMPRENTEALLVDSQVILRQEAQDSASRDQGSGAASSGEIVREEQRAKSDDAATVNPTQSAQVLTSEGRIDPANIESGTNAPVVTTTTSQSVPPGGAFDSGSDERSAVPGGTPGAGAPNDDSGTRQNTARIINTSFNAGIKPQPNILDQYASYTYSLAWYLMAPNAYQALMNSARKSINGFQLLMQSAGAPAGTASTQAQTTTSFAANNGGGTGGPIGPVSSPVGGASEGRNPFFTNDYYIDNLEITNFFPGRGTQSAHNLMDMKFTVTEPNGITLLGNLYRAVDDYYKKIGATAGSPGDYANAEYCLVVRFYGYNDQGQLVQVGKDRNSATDARAVVEKFYPFHLTNITFRVTGRQIEYQVTAKPIAYDIAFGSNRGVVPYPTELTGRTVKDILVGKVATAATSSANDGRADSNQAPQGGSSGAAESALPFRGDGRFYDDDIPSPFQVGA